MMMLPWPIIIVFTVSILSPTVLHAFNPDLPRDKATRLWLAPVAEQLGRRA
jgi:hypothetical protein